jgi:septal ring factor EnvC (AmiA/AmiB activator)
MNLHGLKLRLNKLRKERYQLEQDLNKEYRTKRKDWIKIEKLNNYLKNDLRKMELIRKQIENLRKKKDGRK